MCLESFVEESPALAKADLFDRLEKGLQLLTDYSGAGQPEHVAGRLTEIMIGAGRHPRIQIARASDIAPHCQASLAQMQVRQTRSGQQLDLGFVIMSDTCS